MEYISLEWFGLLNNRGVFVLSWGGNIIAHYELSVDKVLHNAYLKGDQYSTIRDLSSDFQIIFYQVEIS
jgi:hypothetical protein